MKRHFPTIFLWFFVLAAMVFVFPHHAAQASSIKGTGFSLLAFGTISMFETRTMLQIIAQLKRPKTFLLDTFFPGFRQFDTANVDIDIFKGKRRLAPFVSPVMEGKPVEKLGYTTNSYKPPYVKPKMPTTAQEILNRQAGQVVYGNQSLPERAAAELGRNLGDLLDMITRREEWMAAQALNGGVISVTGDGVNDTIDFQMAAGHKITLSGGALWTAAGTSHPITDLTTWARLCAQDSGIVPNVVVMGSDVANAFINHADIKGNTSQFSSVKVNLGVINPQLLPNGATYIGTINAPSLNVDVYSYDEWYISDADGLEYPMVPVNKLFMGSTVAQNSRLYGAIQDLEAIEELGASTIAVPRFPKTWVTKDPSVRWLMVQSAPLVALNQPDASVVATCV